MNILVTGAGGQLGREMIRAVEGTSHRYFFTTRQDLDIADTEAVRAMVQDNGIDLIVNCAAYTDVNRAESDRETADLMNHVAVGGMAAVMKSAEEHWSIYLRTMFSTAMPAFRIVKLTPPVL